MRQNPVTIASELSQRVENALNEARMLLLGGQVLLGFSYRICFEPKFDQISSTARLAELGALSVMSFGLCWLLWPASFHQIAVDGRDTRAMEALTTRVLDWALFPFIVGLGLAIYPAAVAIRAPLPLVIAIATSGFAFVAWYGAGFATRRRAANSGKQSADKSQGDIGERIKKVLIECRMGLPGAQAFLGFQFAIIFADSFDRLPRHAQWVHFSSMLSTIIAIVLLIAPAAYHRLAEGGEDTERFHSVASRFLLAGLVFLAPGVAGDLWVVLDKVTGSVSLATVVASLLLLGSYGLWFAASCWRRRARRL